MIFNKLKKSVLYFGCCILFAALISGCGKPYEPPAIYWPTPPDVPRIKFVKAVYSSRDVKKKDFFARLKEVIVGDAPAEGLAKPFGVFAKDEKLYVADTIQRVVRVLDFKNLKFYTVGRSGRGRLMKPLDVFVGGSGRIYVCDATAKRIILYNKKHEFIRAIGKRGVIGRPGGVVVNEEIDEGKGRIYVSDIIKHKVHIFDLKGNELFSFGQRGIENGEFNYPTSMAINDEGEVFVVDSMNFRVQIFDPDGKFKRKFGEVGDQFGQFARPKGIAIDTEGHIYVADAAFNNIQIFSPEGNLLLFFANMGYKRGELWMPSGIGIDEKNQIYVADQYNHRVNVYQYLTEEEGNKILDEEEKKDEAVRNDKDKAAKEEAADK